MLKIKIYGANGKAVEIEALADTGATFTKIPKSIASELELVPKYEKEIELGDRRVIKRKIALAEVEIEGERGFVPISFGEEEERNLLGCTTLQFLGFKVNPITGKLEKVRAIE